MNVTKDADLNSDKMQWVKLFQQAGISYCILRDIKCCVEGRPPLEIDILIDSDHLPMVREILFRTGYLLITNRAEHPHFHFYLYKTTGLVSVLDIVIDLRVGNSGKLMQILKPHDVLSNCKVINGINVVSEDDELVLLLLHNLIDKGIFLEKHKPRFKEILKVPEYRISAELKLSSLTRDRITSRKLFENLTRENYTYIINNKNKVIQCLFLNTSILDKNNILLNWFYLRYYNKISWFFKLFKLVHKCKIYTVVGIDGSGKTTFIREFSHTLSVNCKIVPCQLGYGALRKYWLELTNLMCLIPINSHQNKYKKNKKTTNVFISEFNSYVNKIIEYILERKPFRFYRYLIPPLLLYFEDIIALRESEKKAGNGGIVITDRSGIDLLVDILSQKRILPWIYRFLYLNIYPSPDIIILLDCGAETAVKRKGEMTIPEAKIYNEAYIYFLARLNSVPALRIDSNSSIDDMIKIVKLASQS